MLGKILVGLLVAAGVFLVYSIFSSSANASEVLGASASPGAGVNGFGSKPNANAPANWGGGGGASSGSSMLSGYTGGKTFNKQNGPIKMADVR